MKIVGQILFYAYFGTVLCLGVIKAAVFFWIISPPIIALMAALWVCLGIVYVVRWVRGSWGPSWPGWPHLRALISALSLRPRVRERL
jgi:hypothetical protein